MATASPPIQALDAAAKASEALRLSAQFDLAPGEVLNAKITSSRYKQGVHVWLYLEHRVGNTTGGVHHRTQSVKDALRHVAKKFPEAALQPDSVKVSVEKGPVKSAELKGVLVQAVHEAYGRPIPSLEEVAAARKGAQAARKEAGSDAASQLRSGPAGVRAFNKRPPVERSACVLRKADLSGCDLTGVDFAAADLEGADFSGATLVRATFNDGPNGCRLKGAKFGRADLSHANLALAKCREADFTGAKLAEANLRSAGFALARFSGADLTQADFSYCDLKGADFSGATLTGCRFVHTDLRGADFSKADPKGLGFTGAEFDEQTRWPKGFKPAAEMSWKGEGADPRLAPSAREKSRPKPTDFAGFLDRLKKAADEAKLGKALSMLKADRFRLFARVRDDHLVGVVKSQSDPTLVYSCRLGADGSYSCCTQNLNVCGGLRGSPCKHLLVLVVGLTQAGELDPAAAHDWSQSARGRKPSLDKDLMTETLLQYKGAEAGEVDWRPTETIPEDFYAM